MAASSRARRRPQHFEEDVYTGQITSAVWIDTKLLRLELVPGSTEPGGRGPRPPYVTPVELPHLMAAFNGGFRFDDAYEPLPEMQRSADCYIPPVWEARDFFEVLSPGHSASGH